MRSLTRRSFCRTALAGAAALTVLRVPDLEARGVHDFVVQRVTPASWPDGVEKRGGMLLVNGRFPGPTIRAREGDLVTVRVRNGLADEGTTLHWHGMTQKGTWEMDGVAYVSQDPIAPGETFEYRFRAEPAGTHLWHSHTGVQYGEGLFGMLIVDGADEPAVDAEVLVLLNDWFHRPSTEILAGLTAMHPGAMDPMSGQDLGDVPFESALVNGKGRYLGSRSPLEVFPVQAGQRVRFRLANLGSTYQLRVRIDGHRMQVIAADGMPTRPLEVDSVDLDLGERCDVVVEMDQPAGNYWLRANTLEQGVDHGARAIVRYAGAPEVEPAESPASWGTVLDYGDLRDARGGAVPAPDHVGLHRLGGSMMPYRWTFDGQAFQLPARSFRTDPNPPEPPVTRVRVRQGQNVRLVLDNPTGMSHPFHIHGRHFHLLARGAGEFRDGLPLNLDAPVRKDTVSIPASGHAVVQWREDNPGFWFFHCHIEWHMATGMAVVIESTGGDS